MAWLLSQAFEEVLHPIYYGCERPLATSFSDPSAV